MSQSSHEFDDLLDKVPRLKNRIAVTELSGGLTNRNLKISTASGDYVARISSNKSSLLAIDRRSEYENSRIAAGIGVGAPVFDYLPDFGLLVIGYIPGKTYSEIDVSNNLSRIASTCKLLHKAAPFTRDFDMFVIQKNYQKLVTESGFRFPNGYHQYAPHLSRMKTALAILDEVRVPCNNDLLPANFIDDGKKIWLIDYEYSGNNDPCFELGNIWSEAKLPLSALDELVTSYYGGSRPEKLARAWLFALLAKYGWTLWASIQNSVSEIDFDFWQWGMEKFEDVQVSFASNEFEQALTQVTQKSLLL
ncbi:MAG: LPS biosynthesis choline kinase [Candidatus Planktophila sp.]|nr:LPS biosynthesis choline kinase [Candidatus Planktophila sp.]